MTSEQQTKYTRADKRSRRLSDAKRRYLYIRYLLAIKGTNLSSLHRKYCAKGRGCDYSLFLRVCNGKRNSRFIRAFVEQELGEKIFDE